MLSRRERLDAAMPALRALFASRGVVLAYVFGSVAQGRERADSDLDIAVLLRPDVPANDYFQIELDLNTEIVGCTHIDDVDVVILNRAPPLLAYEVIAGGHLIFGRHEDRVTYEVRAITEFIDTQPIRKAQEQAYLRRLDALAARGKGGHVW
jgi:hypothetical protein